MLNKAATDKAMPVNFTFIFVFMNNLISVGQPRDSSSDDAWTLSPAGGMNRLRIARIGRNDESIARYDKALKLLKTLKRNLPVRQHASLLTKHPFATRKIRDANQQADYQTLDQRPAARDNRVASGRFPLRTSTADWRTARGR
ncbi:hypothetical protein [Burkholderia pseudomultivorans]|uniref:hypothetical protein n=1 Tax=Burkholderia pseudomultivorans TaxID=1207504 RepID=UPI0018C8C40F|nr:hypothetical protein [Burkholderia pseudomultivorans]